MRRNAFTMIELIFVIVVMGIIGKFGMEFIAQAYRNFIYTNINSQLQSKSEAALEEIASRLQFRIKDSVIARVDDGNLSHFEGLPGTTLGGMATILEWVGYDVDSFRGESKPYWSGIIDIDSSSANLLISPETNTTQINTTIQNLSGSTSDINDSALYFVGSNNNVKNGYGWDGNLTLINSQNGVMHPIRQDSSGVDRFVPINATTKADNTFSGVEVYEYYTLAWSAYAVELNTTSRDLVLHYNYQPWLGEDYRHDGNTTTIMQNVQSFRFKAVGSVIKLQICVKSNVIDGSATGDYSLCKEKTVF